jgi:hypothetical protein
LFNEFNCFCLVVVLHLYAVHAFSIAAYVYWYSVIACR